MERDREGHQIIMPSTKYYEGQFDASIAPPTSSPAPLLPTTNPSPGNGEAQASKTGWKRAAFERTCLALEPWWNTVLITSCVIAVSFDPLFFYIPYTSADRKCMGRDDQVQTVALIFRSITDIGYLAHIVYQLYAAIKFGLSVVTTDASLDTSYDSVSSKQMREFIRGFSHNLSWRSFLTDLLSILPLPQVLIVGLFFKIGGTDYLFRRKIVSGLALIQYIPRVYRIYLSSPTIIESAIWLRGLFNLFLYILASHVLGAFWYFFSIQRETSCWYQNCIANNNPESLCTFYCHGNTTSTLISPQFNTTLDDQCLLKVPNSMTDPPFDFGIFFDLLKNDMQGKINFPEKIGYCFWWGLRNLSNFGTNLGTSTYLWENIFAIVISIVGLLLFLYLIGNVQIYMERATTRAEEVKDKLQKKKNDIDEWMADLGVKKDMEKEIRKHIKKELIKDIDADLEDLYSLLPDYTRKIVMRIIGMKTLRNVPILSNAGTDVKVLKLMCDYMKSKTYKEGEMIFEMHDALDRMVFITKGTVIRGNHRDLSSFRSHSHGGEATTTTEQHLTSQPSIEIHALKKGDCYGTELLHYASNYTNQLPTLFQSVKCDTKVEVLTLKATDLREIAIRCRGQGLWPDFPNPQEDQVPALPGKFQQQQKPAGLKQRVQQSHV